MVRTTKNLQLMKAPFPECLPHAMFFRSANLEVDSQYPLHRHGWGEFVYSFRGVMEVTVGSRHYLAPAQYGIWIPQNVEHVGSSRNTACFSSLYLSALYCQQMPTDVCTLATTSLTRTLLDALLTRKADYPRDEAQMRLFQVLVDELAQSTRHDTYLPMSGDAQLLTVLLALQEQPSCNRSLEEWAQVVHSTERTLSRRCQRDLGMSFSEWRQRLRFVSALRMLEGELTVQTIALELGYSNASAFIAMFQRLAGTSPEDFRRSRRLMNPGLPVSQEEA